MIPRHASTAPGLIFAPGPSGAWDEARVSGPRVLRSPDGRLFLYYVGCDETAGGITDELGMTQQIGLAASDGDPTRWQRFIPGAD